jgi:hypothetical protein
MDDAHSAAAEANRLYWQTDAPVADIAAQLDLSRRALYDVLRPLPTGATCPSCGGEIGFPNRSARTAGLAICASCGAEAADAEAHEEPAPEPWTWSPPRDLVAGALDRRVLWMGGAALAGALVAAAATLLILPED